VPALNKLYADYRDRAEFFIVYITEAHPVDAWQVESNVKDDVLVATTKTADERDETAGVCVKDLGIQLPAIVDEPDDRVERAYTAWPDRIYVIDRNGVVAYKSPPGPFGFKPAEAEATLERLVNETATDS
jgi:type I thyroxine 5'-deiodinase